MDLNCLLYDNILVLVQHLVGYKANIVTKCSLFQDYISNICSKNWALLCFSSKMDAKIAAKLFSDGIYSEVFATVCYYLLLIIQLACY